MQDFWGKVHVGYFWGRTMQDIFVDIFVGE